MYTYAQYPGTAVCTFFELFEIETSHRIIRIESCAKFLQFKDLFFISSDLQGCVHIDACLSAGTSQARVNVNATHAKKSSFRTPFVFLTTTKFSTLLTISSSRAPKIDLRLQSMLSAQKLLCACAAISTIKLVRKQRIVSRVVLNYRY